jgi:hypothetical protein
MARRRPGSLVTFAVLNFVLALLLLICGISDLAGIKGEATTVVNGLRSTVDLKEYLQENVAGYAAYPFISLTASILLAAGFVVSGVGLLQVQNWGRILAVVSAAAAMAYQLFDSVYQLGFVIPAVRNLMGGVPLVGGMAAGAYTGKVVVWALLVVAYSIVLLVSMLQGNMARVFAGDYRGQPEPDDDYRRRPRRDDYDDDYDDRPRRRSRRNDDDDDYDDRPRRRRRPDDDDY